MIVNDGYQWRIYGGRWGRTPTSRSNFFHFHAVFSKNVAKQECIPVACVLPACCPYLPACTTPGGTSPGGVPAQRGVAPAQGGTCPGGVPAQRGVAPAQRGTCRGGTCPGGVPDPGACWDTHASPREQNDRQVQKYYLAANFACGR